MSKWILDGFDRFCINIYTDVTKELKRSEFESFDLYFKMA